jgi:hypothetical protein
MSGLSKIISRALSCVLLTIGLVASAKADTIENLSFDGFANCIDSFCASFGSGPVSGTYSLDVNMQTIVGPWSFSTPFAVISSSGTGANSSIVDRFGDINPGFAEDTSTFAEFVQFFFPGADTQEIGALATNINSDACIPITGQEACHPDYTVTGVNQLISTTSTPEPSSLIFLGVAMLAVVGFSLKKSLV